MNMWKYISMAALAMMMVACSNDDAAIDNAQGKVMTLTTTLKMADNASTRTLTDETTQITAEWAVGDQFTIFYQTTADDISDPTAKSGSGVAEVKSVSGGTATVQATLADALNGGAIDFSYPHAHNDPGTDHNTDQVGTLDDINANFACMYGSGTMSVSGTTVSIDDGGVTMTQEICIWKFTFSDGTNDITSAITNLTIDFAYTTYDINPVSQSAIYVAIYDNFPYTTGAVTITATTASGVYTASKPSVTLQVGQMYESNVVVLQPLAARKTLTAVTASELGWRIGSDGIAYEPTGALPTGVTTVAKICYVSGTGHGLALALADEGYMNWSTALTTCAAHTAPFTGGTWKLASKDEWDNMISAAGSYTDLRDGFSSVGGTNMQSDDRYWSSTDSDPGYAWVCNFSNGHWGNGYKDFDYYVRACLAF